MPASPPRTAEQEAERIRATVPRFNGVRPTPDGKWQAYVRSDDRSWVLVAEFDTPGEAWNCYRAEWRQRREKPESADYIERLLMISASFPVMFEVEASIHGSSMDVTRQEWQEEMA
jgi:hypothetical protein